MPLRVAVMASGAGSNFSAILKGIEEGRVDAEIVLLISDKNDAGAVEIAQNHGIATKIISKRDFRKKITDKTPSYDSASNGMASTLDNMAEQLEIAKAFDKANRNALLEADAELVVLAGYLSIVGPKTINAFRDRIINIHPALLPSFGGDGFYGRFVHQSVIDAGCKVSGATVHFVDEGTDTGPIIAQGAVPVYDDDDAKALAARVLEVEHQLLPAVVDDIAHMRLEIHGRRVIRRSD